MKKVKLSPEEKILKKAAKDKVKSDLLAVKLAKKDKKALSEKEIVHKYVNRVLKNQAYHGRVDEEKFKGLKHDIPINKDLWLDNSFFFSVVFQSTRQKLEFFEKWDQFIEDWDNKTVTNDIRIINGLKFAKSLGITLTKEAVREYPTGNMDLLPYVLDDEKL